MSEDRNDTELTTDEVSVDEKRSLHFDCGFTGDILFPNPDDLSKIEFTSPPSGSPNAGRLLLASVTASVTNGGLTATIDLANHTVTITYDPAGNDRQLLIRIATGVRLYKVVTGNSKVFAFGYETSDGFNVVPFKVASGTEKSTMPAVALLATPIPPRNAADANAEPTFKELTTAEWNTRRKQV